MGDEKAVRADVQLSHGHLRIANRLYEALLDADFTHTQLKIMHGLIRVTYGWGRKTVQLSHAELAATIGLRVTGTFRKALGELVAEGPVVCLSRGVGHDSAVYAVQKDYTRWGLFAIHPDRLARRFGTRPRHRDDLLDPPGSECLDSGTPDSSDEQEKAVRVPKQRQSECLRVGRDTVPNSLQERENDGPKAIERQLKTVTTPVADAPAESPMPVKADTFNLAPYIDLATEVCGECSPPGARWGKLFKSLERKYGREEVLRRWRIMLERKGEWARRAPEDLGANWSLYASAASEADNAATGNGPRTLPTTPRGWFAWAHQTRQYLETCERDGLRELMCNPPSYATERFAERERCVAMVLADPQRPWWITAPVLRAAREWGDVGADKLTSRIAEDLQQTVVQPEAGAASPTTSRGRAGKWAELARTFDLYAYSGNAEEYEAKRALAKASGLIGEKDFDAEWDQVRLWDRIGSLPEHLAILEISARLTVPPMRKAS